MSKPNLLISECLCGVCCRYDGNHNKIDCLEELKSLYNLIPVCPEVLGGLLTPRPPAERIGDRVQTRNGIDLRVIGQKVLLLMPMELVKY